MRQIVVQRPQTPPAAVLLRLSAADDGWVSSLPAVPDGLTVTVSVGDSTLARVPADDLVSRGIRIVAVGDGDTETPVGAVDILVPRTLADAYPDWFSSLLRRADRAFDTSHGPVQAVFARTIATHLRALQTPHG